MRRICFVSRFINTTISETELWSTYFDSIVSCIAADSERSILLSWLDKTVNSSTPLRPDAIISVIDQLKFGQTLGHGEVKTAQQICDKAALCLDLARIACFNKETIDGQLLESAIVFQIHVFATTFYLTKPDYDGLYAMFEIGHLDFPSSLAQLPTFLNLTLLLVCKAFWKYCKVPHLSEIVQQRCRPSLQLADLINITDPTRDRSRNCSIRF